MPTLTSPAPPPCPHPQKTTKNIKFSFKTTEISAELGRRPGLRPGLHHDLSALMTGCAGAGGREPGAAPRRVSPGVGSGTQPHSPPPSRGRQFQGTVSLHQGHPVAKTAFQEEKGLRQAGLHQMLLMKTTETRGGWETWISSRQVYQALGSVSLSILPDFPLSIPPNLPIPPVEFLF